MLKMLKFTPKKLYNGIMLKIVEITDRQEWNDFVKKSGHPLQLWGWGELKASGSWKIRRVFIVNSSPEVRKKKEKYSDVVAAAQILVRKLPFPFKNFAYIPRGPIVLSQKNQEREKMLELLADYCKNNIKPRPVALSVEPDWEDFPENLLTKKKWRRAKNTILIPQTLILDLAKTEADLLADMSKKTRQYIRKSGAEITVREINSPREISQALEIYAETAKRAGFAIHDEKYYFDLKNKLGDNSPIFAAFAKKQPAKTDEEAQETDIDPIQKLRQNEEMVAFLWNIQSEKIAFELYGGITEKGQKYRANYILKWLTIQQARNSGVERYDMNGLLNDGISKFKIGFSSHQDQLAGTLDRPLRKSYWIWNNFLPTAKKIIRKFRK